MDSLAEHVRSGEVRGIVALVSRRGEADVRVFGDARRDDIFRISSMTKPVAAAAALMLVERGRLRLDAPVDALLPELSARRVLRRIDGPLDDTVPARRAITLRDLLTFTMGFGLVFDRSLPVAARAEELKLGAFGPPKPSEPPPPDEWMKRFGTLPLMAQPGERWMYNTGFEVLGVLLARAAGQGLPELLRELVFAPLGMKDTGFFVPREKLHRLPPSLWTDGSVFDPPDGMWSRPPAFPSAAAGLVSTVDDMHLFGRALLEGRLLPPAMLAEMARDQLAPEQKAPFFPGFWEGRGWGLGVSVKNGWYGWDGGLGTSWANHPAQDAVAILMTQKAGPPDMMPVYRDFWSQV